MRYSWTSDGLWASEASSTADRCCERTDSGCLRWCRASPARERAVAMLVIEARGSAPDRQACQQAVGQGAGLRVGPPAGQQLLVRPGPPRDRGETLLHVLRRAVHGRVELSPHA